MKITDQQLQDALDEYDNARYNYKETLDTYFDICNQIYGARQISFYSKRSMIIYRGLLAAQKFLEECLENELTELNDLGIQLMKTRTQHAVYQNECVVTALDAFKARKEMYGNLPY